MIYFTNSHIISRSPVATAIRYGALHPMPRPDIGTARIMPMPIGPFYLGPYIQQLPIVLLLALMIIIISLDGIPKREVRNLDRPTAKQKEKKRVSRTGRSFLSDCSNVGATCRLFWQGHRSQPTGLSLSLLFSLFVLSHSDPATQHGNLFFFYGDWLCFSPLFFSIFLFIYLSTCGTYNWRDTPWPCFCPFHIPLRRRNVISFQIWFVFFSSKIYIYARRSHFLIITRRRPQKLACWARDKRGINLSIKTIYVSDLGIV